ncbi:hypothetical protein BHE74_00042639 [Ensete ventricosum]|nr:hypothetical protein BHE74_00042639 [Ensete ventricosum]
MISLMCRSESPSFRYCKGFSPPPLSFALMLKGQALLLFLLTPTLTSVEGRKTQQNASERWLDFGADDRKVVVMALAAEAIVAIVIPQQEQQRLIVPPDCEAEHTTTENVRWYMCTSLPRAMYIFIAFKFGLGGLKIAQRWLGRATSQRLIWLVLGDKKDILRI